MVLQMGGIGSPVPQNLLFTNLDLMSAILPAPVLWLVAHRYFLVAGEGWMMHTDGVLSLKVAEIVHHVPFKPCLVHGLLAGSRYTAAADREVSRCGAWGRPHLPDTYNHLSRHVPSLSLVLSRRTPLQTEVSSVLLRISAML
jgi:hypothetical protein